MTRTVHNPHDKLFRETFARIECLVSFLRAFLPTDVGALFNDASPEPYPGTFVDEELRLHASDLIYKFSFNGTQFFLYLLFEHQRTPDPNMPLRLIQYIIRLWEDIRKKNPDMKQLPVILPLVLYQGKADWNTSLQFRDMVNPAPALVRFTPAFEYLLVDLKQPAGRDQVKDLRCRFVLHLMHAAATGTLLDTFRRHGALLAELLESLARNNELTFFETLLRYAMSVDEALDVDTLKQTINDAVNKEAGDFVMSLADRLIAEGQAKGEATGQIKGEIRLLQTLLKLKFPNTPPVNLEGLSLEQLETIGKRILTCNSVEETLQGFL